MRPLNLFYEEPNPDRWLKHDRHIRNAIRRIIRGKPRPGGQMMVALELMKGLDLLKIPYRFNDYSYAQKNPNELIGVIGKSFLLAEKKFKNPILFGASVFSHPLEAPNFLAANPNVKKILVPGEWMKKMFKPYYEDLVEAWPVGIDTAKWNPQLKKASQFDFLIYNKIRWDLQIQDEALFSTISNELEQRNLTSTTVKYGSYTPEELREKVAVSKAVIFLCEHETQGLAYQQILATGTPILAYDQEDFWLDPSFYPNQVQYGPVSSVPYWNEKCGVKFKSATTFASALTTFQDKFEHDFFDPRSYILDHLTLEKCASNYHEIYTKIAAEL